MKYIITIILILISVECFSQTPVTKPEEKIVMPPDSVAIVSLKDYNTFFIWLQENISKSAYDKLTPDKLLIEFYNWAVLEWNRKKKK